MWLALLKRQYCPPLSRSGSPIGSIGAAFAARRQGCCCCCDHRLWNINVVVGEVGNQNIAFLPCVPVARPDPAFTASSACRPRANDRITAVLAAARRRSCLRCAYCVICVHKSSVQFTHASSAVLVRSLANQCSWLLSVVKRPKHARAKAVINKHTRRTPGLKYAVCIRTER